jgi:hypothetical protein
MAYLLTRRYFGSTVALVAGLLYAVNPWAATFARQPWVITQPLLTALMLFAAMKVVVDRDRRWAIGYLLALAAQSQTHLLAVLYGPPALLSLLLFPRRWLGREFLVGLLGALLIVGPYALHLWGIQDAILDALARGNRGMTLAPQLDAARLILWLISGYQLEAKLGFEAPWLAALRVPLLVVLFASGALLALGTWVAAAACIRRHFGWEAHALLLVWFLSPLALMTWQSSAVYMHYLLVLLPTPFMLIGLGLVRGVPELRASLGRAVGGPAGLGRVAGSTLAAICAIQILVLTGFYAALHSMAAAPRAALTPSDWQARLNDAERGGKQAGIGELHGLPLAYWQSVADLAKAQAARAQTDDVVVLTGIQDDANRHLDKRRKAIDYLLGPSLDARFPLEGLTVLPTGRDTLFLTLPEQDLPRLVRSGASPLGERALPGTDGETRLWLVRARPAGELVRPRRPATARFQNGVQLLGLDAPARADAGQTIPLTTYWLVERAAPSVDEDDETFVELRVGGGSMLARRAAGGLPSAEWRTGDLLIQRSTLTIPPSVRPGEYSLVAGLASRTNGDRVAVTDQTGREIADVATIAAISIGGN